MSFRVTASVAAFAFLVLTGISPVAAEPPQWRTFLQAVEPCLNATPTASQGERWSKWESAEYDPGNALTFDEFNRRNPPPRPRGLGEILSGLQGERMPISTISPDQRELNIKASFKYSFFEQVHVGAAPSGDPGAPTEARTVRLHSELRWNGKRHAQMWHWAIAPDGRVTSWRWELHRAAPANYSAVVAPPSPGSGVIFPINVPGLAGEAELDKRLGWWIKALSGSADCRTELVSRELPRT